jgi:ribosomal protein S18 acetylase RimI-like enzyme
MISIEKNEDTNFTAIRAIAKEVWPIAYGTILSEIQLDYMMEMMYSIDSLQLQANSKNHHFILANENDVTLGFASYEFNISETSKTKIHKIYILSTQQGKGIGKKLIDFIHTEAKNHHQEALLLNVNKYNSAQDFYKKLGFTIDHEEVIDIGNGYVMDDYVMQKAIL